MAAKSYVVVFPSVYPRRHVTTLARNIRRILRVEDEQFTSVGRDGDIVLVDAHDPVFASAAVGLLFGVDRTMIARQTANSFDDVVGAVSQVGGSLLLGGERFLVRAEGYSRGFLPRDVEMAATSRIIEEKSSSGVRPGTPERHDKLLYAYMTKRHAYVSIFADEGPGGLPTGIQGRAVCCVFDEISAAACRETMRMGFEVQVVVCYAKESDITGLARIADRLIRGFLRESVPVVFRRIRPASDSYGDAAASATGAAVLEAPEWGATHVGLPASRMAFPGDLADGLADMAVKAGLVPLVVLGDYGQVRRTLVRLNLEAALPGVRRVLGRLHACGAAADGGGERLVVDVRAGPNSLHHMLDSLHGMLEF